MILLLVGIAMAATVMGTAESSAARAIAGLGLLVGVVLLLSLAWS